MVKEPAEKKAPVKNLSQLPFDRIVTHITSLFQTNCIPGKLLIQEPFDVLNIIEGIIQVKMKFGNHP